MKKIFSLLLTFALFAAVPLTAFADDPESADYQRPFVTGSSEITLVPGYAAVETEPYIITGYPTPTVTLSYTYGGVITWDDDAKTIKIAAGLEKGVYLVFADARNSEGSFTFTLRVTVTYKKPAPPDTGSMGNFVRGTTYTPGMFTDVDEDTWYGFNQNKVIANAYEYGLMKGGENGNFNPSGNITIAEAVTVAARVHSIYMTGADSFAQTSPWYQVYVDYAIDNGIIAPDDFTDYNRTATRAEMAYIFAYALPDSQYPYRWYTKTWDTKTPPDVNESTPYMNEIVKLYDTGIVGGSDEAGTFHPANNITRAEAAAIIARLIKAVPRLGSEPMPS